jgi:hypothetical protein
MYISRRIVKIVRLFLRASILLNHMELLVFEHFDHKIEFIIFYAS